jgi:NitT/TauT family transport system permease protein/taurine transport system permease protein
MTRRLRRTGAALGLLVVWQVVSAVVLPRLAPSAATLMPPPLGVATAFIDLARSGDLALHIVASLRRVVAAFAMAAAAGVALGVAIGWWRRFGELVDPLVELVRPIPPLAWIPLAIIWFGIGDTQNMFIIFLGAFFPVVVNTIEGVRGVDRPLVWAALTLGGTRVQILSEIVLPGALPLILTGLRIGLGVGWMALVAAELVAASSGLGFLIEDSRNLLFTERVLLGMLLIGLLGFAMDRLMRRLERRLTPWVVS